MARGRQLALPYTAVHAGISPHTLNGKWPSAPARCAPSRPAAVSQGGCESRSGGTLTPAFEPLARNVRSSPSPSEAPQARMTPAWRAEAWPALESRSSLGPLGPRGALTGPGPDPSREVSLVARGAVGPSFLRHIM